jgi:uncharacterized membrane protein YgdD (TMEM256/DUF423 family)
MKNKLISTGIIIIVTSIILGAFGAHALEKVVNEEKLRSFEVGIKYQMYQGLGLLVLASLFNSFSFSLKLVFRLQLIGIILFSLSIYGLVLTPLIGINLKMLFGPLTPIGGLLMIIGWIILLIKHIKTKGNE